MAACARVSRIRCGAFAQALTCRRVAVCALVLITAACTRPSRSAAQSIPKSQTATVIQQVAGARIEIVYRRPVARGRSLFGALVPWGGVWSPSADSAPRLTVSTPITINGSALPAGTYTLWAIPDSVSWTIIFNGTPAAFHLRYPEGHDVLRVQATPVRGEHVETLLFTFP